MKYDIFISYFLTIATKAFTTESQCSSFIWICGPLRDSTRPNELFISGTMMILILFPREWCMRKKYCIFWIAIGMRVTIRTFIKFGAAKSLLTFFREKKSGLIGPLVRRILHRLWYLRLISDQCGFLFGIFRDGSRVRCSRLRSWALIFCYL